MRGSRRHALTTTIAGTAPRALGSAPHPEQSPRKPVRIIVSTTPGSQPDALSRMIGQKLAEAWAKPVVMDIRSGAGGTIAAMTVAKAAPDGHTLLYTLPNFAISAVLQPSLPYDPIRDFAGVTQV